jgi:hypothetical protein
MLTVNHNEKLKSEYIFLSLVFRDPCLMYNFSLRSLDMSSCSNSSAYICIHPEECNRNMYQNVGLISTWNGAKPQNATYGYALNRKLWSLQLAVSNIIGEMVKGAWSSDIK